MQHTTDAQKGHTVRTSGKTLLQGHLSFYPHISANYTDQGKVLISVSFLILLLFSGKHTSFFCHDVCQVEPSTLQRRGGMTACAPSRIILDVY